MPDDIEVTEHNIHEDSPQNPQPIPATSLARLTYLIRVAFQLHSKNPRLFLFLGLNALLNVILFWMVQSAVSNNSMDELSTASSNVAFTITLSAFTSFLVHFFQCSLVTAALAVLRGHAVAPRDAFQITLTRIMPLGGLALLTTCLGTLTQFLTLKLGELDAGIVSLPIVLAWLIWFVIDLLAIVLISETPGSFIGYLAGAGRITRRIWNDSLALLLVYLLTTSLLAPLLVSSIASSITGADPSGQTMLVIASISTIIHNLILSFISVYAARLYIYAITSR